MADTKNKKRLHSYHASANAFGGRLERPIQQHLPSLASICLPSVGGYDTALHKDFRFHEIFSIDEASSHVGGSFDPKTGNWTTIATSVLKGLNVAHTLFADRIVAQISVEHPADGYHPRVSFLGTRFDGLRIGDCELKPCLHLHLCDNGTVGAFPGQSHLKNQKLVNSAHEQSKAFAKFWLAQKGADGKPLRGMQDLDKDGENSKGVVEERGSVVCSLVDKIEGKCAGITGGHAIYIPDFGRVFLGELRVEHGAFDLTMLRLDLGSPSAGSVSGAQAAAGGGNKGSQGGITT
jgi:hypothetical protein